MLFLAYDFSKRNGVITWERRKRDLIHVSVDGNLKNDAEQLFNELGINMTMAITVFLRQSVTNQTIPFMIEKGNPVTLQAMKDVDVDRCQ